MCVHTVYTSFAGVLDFKYSTILSELLAIDQYYKWILGQQIVGF